MWLEATEPVNHTSLLLRERSFGEFRNRLEYSVPGLFQRPEGRAAWGMVEGYMDGLRFACHTGCTNCCRQPGCVYLTEDDLRRAAAHLGMRAGAFEKRYVYRTRHLLRLRKPRRSQCPFLEEEGCRIHPDKPTQCRVFPFWPELVERRAGWRAAAKFCPGIGTGPLIEIGSALKASGEMRVAYPTTYPRRRKLSKKR